MRILLVEDDATTSKSIEMLLSHASLNVYTTDLGEEAIDLAKLYDFDLILLDLKLPDMSGHEVLRQLRLARIDTPTLILSGDDNTDSKIRGLGSGADDYLIKPFHREELVARIHAIIRRSKGHSQSIIETGKIALNLDAKNRRGGWKKRTSDWKRISNARASFVAQGNHIDQRDVSKSPIWRYG